MKSSSFLIISEVLLELLPEHLLYSLIANARYLSIDIPFISLLDIELCFFVVVV